MGGLSTTLDLNKQLKRGGKLCKNQSRIYLFICFYLMPIQLRTQYLKGLEFSGYLKKKKMLIQVNKPFGGEA